jgi:hypothetical protein
MNKKQLQAKIRKVLEKEGGAAGMKALKKQTDSSEKDVKSAIADDDKVAQHPKKDVWPSAYASGALVKCRKVGAKNWGNKSKKK